MGDTGTRVPIPSPAARSTASYASTSHDGKGAQELLEEFERTGSQEPFEEIARRYAGMVYNVAMQVTRDAHDAEDATQATFLTLATHAKTAGKIRYVGPWLRKVSHRLALDIRRSKKRRRTREEKHATGSGRFEINGAALPVSNDLQMEELRHILREELDKLPSKYRMPLILYYFGGLSPEEMGKELKVNTSTLGVRLHRGRKMLAESLSGRGLTNINVAVVGVMLGGLVDRFIIDNLAHTASHAAVQVAAAGAIPNGATISAMPVISAIRAATSGIRLARLKGVIACVVLVATTLAGGTEVLRRFDLVDLSSLSKLNPLRLLAPLFDRIFDAPRINLRAESVPTIDPAQLASDSLAGATRSFGLPEWALATPSIERIAAANLAVDPAPVASEAKPAAGIGAAIAKSPPAWSIVSPGSPDDGAMLARVGQLPTLQNLKSIIGAGRLGYETAGTNGSRDASLAGGSGTSFAPSGTTITIDRNVALATPGFGSAGTMRLADGEMSASRIVVADRSQGSLIQSGGKLVASDELVIGSQAGSNGSYTINGAAAQALAGAITVGRDGNGKLVQSAGSVQVGGAGTDHSIGVVTLGDNAGSNGEWVLNGGEVRADSFVVGRAGTGTVSQSGGTASLSYASIGQAGGGKGTWSVSDDGVIQVVQSTSVADAIASGIVTQVPAQAPTPAIIVGGEGSGTVVIRSGRADGAIKEGSGTSGSALLVRIDPAGEGTFRGWGAVNISGPIVQNGSVIADGFGASRTLDLSSASLVTNTIENPSGSGGTNGWYARDGGKLMLPALTITGTKTYTWGEDSYDDVIDLVNSVRLHVRDVEQSGSLAISLLDDQSADVPALPGGLDFISIWEVAGTAQFNGADLMVRLDDAQIAGDGLADSDLALWVYRSGAWSPIVDATLGLDMSDHLLWGTTTGQPSFFAVGEIPEPATLTLLATGFAALLKRHRPAARR